MTRLIILVIAPRLVLVCTKSSLHPVQILCKQKVVGQNQRRQVDCLIESDQREEPVPHFPLPQVRGAARREKVCRDMEPERDDGELPAEDNERRAVHQTVNRKPEHVLRFVERHLVGLQQEIGYEVKPHQSQNYQHFSSPQRS